MTSRADRPVVTAAGMVSALGLSAADAWVRMGRGESGIRPVERLQEPWSPVRFGGEITAAFRPGEHAFHRKMLKVMAWPVRFGVGAARLAVLAAGGEEALFEGVDPSQRGMFTGAGLSVDEDNDVVDAIRASEAPGQGFDLRRFAEVGIPSVNPLWLVKGLTNNVLALVAQGYDLQGPNDNLGSGRAGGGLALHEAAAAVSEGRAQVMLAGGYDSLLHMEKLVGLSIGGRLHTGATPPPLDCSPLGPSARGLVPAEGAATLVVEDPGRARARGATLRARVLGSSTGFVAVPVGGPLPIDDGREVLRRIVLEALDRASCSPDRVDGVVWTASGDPAEAAIFRGVSESLFREAALVTPAGSLGDTGAAASAIAAALAVEWLGHGARRILVGSLSDTGEGVALLLEGPP